MKIQKIILALAIALISTASYAQSKSTYNFKEVQGKSVKNGSATNEQSIGKDCTLIINRQANTYTFSYKGTNKINYEFTFKLTQKNGETFATVVGDDAPKKTEYKVINSLDDKGTIQLIPIKNINDSFALTFK